MLSCNLSFIERLHAYTVYVITNWCVVSLGSHKLLGEQLYLLTQLFLSTFALWELCLFELETLNPLPEVENGRLHVQSETVITDSYTDFVHITIYVRTYVHWLYVYI